ncbi:putative ribonuclease H-like domain-containing protein [Tanacetum coccineum]
MKSAWWKVSGAQNLAFIPAPSTNSTNDTNISSPQVSIASPNVNVASPQVSTASTSDNTVYDKSKVECYNCHKLGYFPRKCRALRSKESQFRNQDNTRKQGNNEDKSSKEMLAIDGVGFDWSEMAEEQVQTNMALMGFSDSEYEVLFSEEVAVLQREVACKDYEINVLKSEFEKVKQEKEGIEFKIKKFDNASKSLNKLLESQITDKKPEFKCYGSEDSKQESNIGCDKKSDDSKENSDDSLVKEQVSKDTSSFVGSPLNVDKETVFLVDKKIEFVKPKNHEKPVKKLVRKVNTAHPKSTVYSVKSMSCFSKSAQSTVKRPYQSKTVLTNKNFTQKVNTAKAQAVKTAKAKVVNTARPKAVNTARPHSAVVNAVRISSNLMEVMLFGGGAHGGRISGKGTLKTDSLDFEDFPNESQILLKIPRKDNMYSFDMKNIDNMYSFDMKNIVPKETLTCLVVKATSDESMLWHRGLFIWVFFLTTKDETNEILKNFIKEIENLVDKKVKIIRSDNATEFKNKVMDDFCREKGIKREYSVARTPQQNSVVERRNKTLIKAARTMFSTLSYTTTIILKQLVLLAMYRIGS